MNAFAIVAARYGVDPTDEEAVDRFFDERAPSLPAEEREAILAELLAADGQGISSPRHHYATGSDDVNFGNDPAVEVPWGAVNPRRLVADTGPATAKLFFVGLDGAEKGCRLQTHRPYTIGRDPGNDIVLLDPKVSRHHAEVVFERGFFVLHDLASATGTYVNGKRVRLTPLTHGCTLRLGNTYGRFAEELPTENGIPAGVGEPFEQPPPEGDFARNKLHRELHELLTTEQQKKK